MARNALPHAPVRIDCRGHAVVGVAQNPAAIFDSAHTRHVQVLPRRAGVAVPSVIADVDQYLGAKLRKLAHFICKHRLIADEYAVAMARATLRTEPEHFAILASIELRYFAGKLAREK